MSRTLAPVPVAVRGVVVLAGAGLALVPSPWHVVTVVLTVLAALAAAVRPERVGALVPTAAFVLGWLAGGGWDATPDPIRTVVAAALLYLLHQAVTLASLLPIDSVVAPGVLGRWVLHCAPAVAIAAVVIALDLLVSRRPGSPLIEAVALVAVLVVLGLALRSVLAPATARSDDRAS